MKLNQKVGKKRSVKDQFVLSVGDDGAILSFFKGGKLENRIFIDSPASEDIKILEKLFITYSNIPIVMLVDVIEQTYSQQVLPPVSPLGIRQQIQKRIKRDFQPNDLSNVLPLGRSKEGRKDWNFLFVSLASTDPFAKWMEFALAQKNKFKGVYLLPVESVRLCHDLNRESPGEEPHEWELLVLHNKIGGFRIVVVKNGKMVFTRLAQNLIGDNIPDIIVGNLEQEVANTVEYLKRLAFKGEQYSKITIVSSSDVLQKIEPQSLKFGKVILYTPFQIAEKLNLPVAVTEKDKFADIFSATYFASCKKHILKFSSPYTKKIEMFYNGIKAAYIVAALASLFIAFLAVSELSDVMDLRKQSANLENDLFAAESKLREVQAKEAKLPADYRKMQEVLEISRLMPKDKYSAYKIIGSLNKVFGTGANGQARYLVTVIEYSRKPPEKPKQDNNNPGQATAVGKDTFIMDVNFELQISEVEQDRLETYNKKLEADLKAALPKYSISLTKMPEAKIEDKFEKVDKFAIDQGANKIIDLPGAIRITGVAE
jgi:hypothetical protein